MKKRNRKKKIIKRGTLLFLLGFTAVMGLLIFQAIQRATPKGADMDYLEFKSLLDSKKIEKVDLIDTQDFFIATTTNGETYKVINPKYELFKKELLESGVKIEIRETDIIQSIITTVTIIPTLLIVYLLIMFIVKHINEEGDKLFKILDTEEKVTFKDIAGMNETKKEVAFAIEQIKRGKELKELGARPIKGIILEGPPGNGKTMIAKAIAGEADVPFISVCGSDFVQMFAGLGAYRVRALWKLANTNAPCVLFIDEIDAIGGTRSGSKDGASQELNQTINALLQKMDGLSENKGIFVIGATNLMSNLDPALLRPGRFDKHLHIGAPRTKEDRIEIIDLYLSNKKIEDEVNSEAVNKLVFGFSGAEIESTLNEAVMISLQNNRNGIISLKDIDYASMKVRTSGLETNHSSEHDRKVTAIHEAGHSVLNILFNRKVSKVSIIPYSSGVGGMTIADVDTTYENKLRTRKEIIEDICILFGGTVAEEVCLGDISIGASNDIEKATEYAHQIVSVFGMSDKYLVNLDILKNHGVLVDNSNVLLEEVNKILVHARKKAEEMVRENIDEVEKLAKELLEKEVILNYEF